MISFDEAYARILAGIKPVAEVESIPVEEALGRVLSSPIEARSHVPNH
ncbi:MAG: molybdopterin molybdenumtransferase MoeA, partial [Magnetococcales bacterium]|nr:molybdopterin molybdenumtransferase MoeA [Magnetococcales bacterium]